MNVKREGEMKGKEKELEKLYENQRIFVFTKTKMS